jgi:hypothetical protein
MQRGARRSDKVELLAKEKAMSITLSGENSNACASRARWCTDLRCCW